MKIPRINVRLSKLQLVMVTMLVVAVGLLAVPALARTADQPSASAHLSGNPTLVWEPGHIIKFPPKKVKGTGVWLVGAGFPPGRTLEILMKWKLGADTDLSWMTSDPPVVTDEEGAFAAGWILRDRFTRVMDEKAYTVRVMDQQTGDLLATAPLVLCNGAKAPEEQSPWCAAAVDLVPIPR